MLKKQKVHNFAASISIFFFPLLASAQITNPLKYNDVSTLVTNVLSFVTKVGAVVAILAFIWVGFLFVKAQGNPEGLKKAKSIFWYTVIGVAILLGAQLLSTLVVGTINSLGK